MSNTNTMVKVAGDQVRMSVPFSKVDESKRMVHGFATLDNLDKVDDIVLSSASMAAFEKFRGNIREMHEMKAVGRMISFRPETFYDAESGGVLNGIFVSTYVSKGAQDTWEKILDGTLTGFSIGAVVKKSRNKYDEDLDKIVRVIEEYELVELSLVDNPMNQLANVVSFEKGVQTGYISEVNSENVFFCRVHNVIQFSDGAFADCHQCGGPMSNIGFVESNDPEKMMVAKAMLANIKNAPIVGDLVEFDEGVGIIDSVYTSGEVALPEDTETSIASEIEPIAVITFCQKTNDTIVRTNHRIMKNLSSITKTEEVKKVSEELEDVVEKTTPEDVEPETVEGAETVVEDTPESVEKSDIAELKEMVSDLTKSLAGLPDIFKSVVEMTAKSNESAEAAQKAASDLAEETKSAKADLEKANNEIKKLGEDLERVDSATALRKSADVGEIVQTAAPEVQSIWGGNFLDTTTKKY